MRITEFLLSKGSILPLMLTSCYIYIWNATGLWNLKPRLGNVVTGRTPQEWDLQKHPGTGGVGRELTLRRAGDSAAEGPRAESWDRVWTVSQRLTVPVSGFPSLMTPRLMSSPAGLIPTFFYFCCSVTKSCLTLCDPMDCSIPGFPVLHCLPELAQTHVLWISDAIQPSVIPFSSCPQSFPVLGSFPMSQPFPSGDRSIEASASVLPMNIHGWFP